MRSPFTNEPVKRLLGCWKQNVVADPCSKIEAAFLYHMAWAVMVGGRGVYMKNSVAGPTSEGPARPAAAENRGWESRGGQAKGPGAGQDKPPNWLRKPVREGDPGQ